jgi:hypothetical protein
MMLFLAECHDRVQLTKFMTKREPEYSITEEVLFDCFTSSVSFQTLFSEMIFLILRLFFRAVSYRSLILFNVSKHYYF